MLASTISRMMRSASGCMPMNWRFGMIILLPHFFQGHDLAELGFFGQFTVLPVVPEIPRIPSLRCSFSVNLGLLRAAALAAHDEHVTVLRPKVTFHLAGEWTTAYGYRFP